MFSFAAVSGLELHPAICEQRDEPVRRTGTGEMGDSGKSTFESLMRAWRANTSYAGIASVLILFGDSHEYE